MEQDRGGGVGGRGMDQMREMQQHQDQRTVAAVAKPHQENQPNHPQPPPPPPQQPQKCPRCDSLNTKFCYYNNYSLSQPRYFCKTCRRYWTQGGTLRNVPVGGGCRKGKRLKRSSSPSPDNQHSSSSATSTLPFRSKGIESSISSSPLVPIAPGAVPVPAPGSMYYPGGGFLSSLPTFQSFNQPLNFGGSGEFGAGGSSNLSLLRGFSLPFHSQQMEHHHQQQHQQQRQQLYLHQSHDLNMGISDILEEKVAVVQQTRPSNSHQEWSQSFSNNPIASSEGGGYWSSNANTNTNATTTSSATTSGLGVSLNSTHWTDHLQGYCPSPAPPQQQQAQPQPPPSTTSLASPSFL